MKRKKILKYTLSDEVFNNFYEKQSFGALIEYALKDSKNIEVIDEPLVMDNSNYDALLCYDKNKVPSLYFVYDNKPCVMNLDNIVKYIDITEVIAWSNLKEIDEKIKCTPLTLEVFNV